MKQRILKRTSRLGVRTALLSIGLSLALVLGACGGEEPAAEVQEADAVVVATDEVVEEEADNAVEEDAEGGEPTATPAPEEETEDTTDTEEVEATATPEAEEEVDTEADAEADADVDTPLLVGVIGAPDQYVRASTLTDYDFGNLEGDDIGDIEDMLIDLTNGGIFFLSVEYGGFLDLGDRDIYLPLSAFVIDENGGLALNMNEEELDAYPEVENDWPKFDDPDWALQINEYWTGLGVEAPDTVNRDSTQIAWASDLIGFPLFGWGDLQSNVVDLLVNLQSGKAEYALIADELIDQDGPYLVPVEALTYDRVNTQLGFDGEIDEEMMAAVPRFDAGVFSDDEVIDTEVGEAAEAEWRDLGFDWWE